MMPPSATSSAMNKDLQREREGATFAVERLTHLLDGGADRTQRRRQLQALIELDPTGIFDNDSNNYLHRTDRHVRALAKHVRLIELCRKIGLADNEQCRGEILATTDFFTLLACLGDDLPTALHWVMFVPNIVSLFDDEQRAHWLPLCRDWRVIGCYAQTELGHGSNVRALETTATFVPEAKGGLPGGSFVIHSPTLTSTKFWPGTLGRTANHAIVIARLIDGDGVDRGIHNFIVPLRSRNDHMPLPGVKTGDIGPKIGYNMMDNGFATFNQVVIPRRNLGMRFVHVDERGKYSKKTASDAAEKILYITMMQVRAYICNESGRKLAMACTIAIRYSAVRLQGFAEDATSELQILSYKQQQHRLFPLLAASYCFFFTGRRILDTLAAIERRLVSNQRVTKVEMADIHASSSALKSYTSAFAADGMEDCRKACGGHGFLQCSGLPELITTFLQNPTVEGDNHMLPQQVVKVLLKLVTAVNDGEDLVQYETCDSFLLVPSLRATVLNEQKPVCSARSPFAMMDLQVMRSAFNHRAARLLASIASQIQNSILSGMSPLDAWNHALVEMARFSRAYSQALLLRDFVDGIQSAERNPVVGRAECSVLRDLAQLLASYWIEQALGDFVEDGYLSAEQSKWVRGNVLTLLERVRPNAVALVDARDFSDFVLKSALGRYDGNVYPAIMEAAFRDPLNQTEPGPGYEQHLKRLIVDGLGVYTGTASRL